jgi:hypothetical protein
MSDLARATSGTEEAAALGSRVTASFTFAPVGDVAGNLAAVLAEALVLLLGMFYPRKVCKKAATVVTELVQNVTENIAFPASALAVSFSVDDDRLLVRVTNRVTREQYAAVAARVAELRASPDPKKLFAQTLRARRTKRERGGLGLIRLVSENKFKLDMQYDGAGRGEDGALTVSAEFALKGLA